MCCCYKTPKTGYLIKKEVFWSHGSSTRLLALRRQRHQPGLQTEFKNSQGYTEKLCLKKEGERGGGEWVGGLVLGG